MLLLLLPNVWRVLKRLLLLNVRFLSTSNRFRPFSICPPNIRRLLLLLFIHLLFQLLLFFFKGINIFIMIRLLSINQFLGHLQWHFLICLLIILVEFKFFFLSRRCPLQLATHRLKSIFGLFQNKLRIYLSLRRSWGWSLDRLLLLYVLILIYCIHI